MRFHLKSDDSVLSSVDYQYEAAENRTSERKASGQRTTWTYDKTNQLVNEHRSFGSGFHTTFTYDAVGNRLVKNEAGALTTSVYDAANQLQTSQDSSGTTTYTFDQTGNQHLVHSPTKLTTSTWDYENQQIGVQSSDGTLVTSIYNADFRRVYKES